MLERLPVAQVMASGISVLRSSVVQPGGNQLEAEILGDLDMTFLIFVIFAHVQHLQAVAGKAVVQGEDIHLRQWRPLLYRHPSRQSCRRQG